MRRYGPLARPAIFILQKRSGILSFDFCFLNNLLLDILLWCILFCGLRGKAPMISLGGNSLYMNGIDSSWWWMIGYIEIAENSSILRWFDRSWWYMISYDEIDYSIHPIPWLGGDLLGGGGCRGWGGGSRDRGQQKKIGKTIILCRRRPKKKNKNRV